VIATTIPSNSFTGELISALVVGGCFVLFIAWAVWADKRDRSRDSNRTNKERDTQ